VLPNSGSESLARQQISVKTNWKAGGENLDTALTLESLENWFFIANIYRRSSIEMLQSFRSTCSRSKVKRLHNYAPRPGHMKQGESQCASRLYFFRSSRNRS
jgi:hypothetical protein